MPNCTLDGFAVLDDVVEAATAGIHSVGLALAFFGLAYINEEYLGNSMQIPPPDGTPVFSTEFAFFAAQISCFLGAGISGAKFVYDSVRVPARFVTGKYFKKNSPRK